MPSAALPCLLPFLLLAAVEGLRTAPDGAPEDFTLGTAEDEESDGSPVQLSPWELAITEAVQEAHPLRSREEGKQTKRRRSQHSKPPSTKQMRWIYGAHHKAGTDLLRHLAQDQDHLMHLDGCFSWGGPIYSPNLCHMFFRERHQLWFRCQLKADWLLELRKKGYLLRVAHMIRDPIAMAVSGYIYHRKSNDVPARLRGQVDTSVVAGLTLEARYILETSGRAMLETYLNATEDVLHLRFESFMQSSESFDETTRALYEYMAGDLLSESELEGLQKKASAHDLRRMNLTSIPTMHVADEDMKKQVKEVVDQMPEDILRQLKDMRRSLGYE